MVSALLCGAFRTLTLFTSDTPFALGRAGDLPVIVRQTRFIFSPLGALRRLFFNRRTRTLKFRHAYIELFLPPPPLPLLVLYELRHCSAQFRLICSGKSGVRPSTDRTRAQEF